MPDELATKRMAKREAVKRERITELLNNLLIGHTEDRIEEGALRGIVVVRMHDSGPVVNCMGVTKDGLRAASSALLDVVDPNRVKFRQENERLRRERMEAYVKAYPFPCSHKDCGKRFETDTGRKIHERACWHIKRDAAKGEEA